MAEQTAELERCTGNTARLQTWERVRGPIEQIAQWIDELEEQFATMQHWERAQQVANRFRSEVLRLNTDDPLSAVSLVDSTAVTVCSAAMPWRRLLGQWALGVGAAPVVALMPSIIVGDPGVMRFSIAHQIGHLLEWYTQRGGRTHCSALAGLDGVASNDPGESFANAFAAYLLAPKVAVRRLLRYNGSGSSGWLDGAARDVAVTFGISHGAAQYHVLNC